MKKSRTGKSENFKTLKDKRLSKLSKQYNKAMKKGEEEKAELIFQKYQIRKNEVIKEILS